MIRARRLTNAGTAIGRGPERAELQGIGIMTPSCSNIQSTDQAASR